MQRGTKIIANHLTTPSLSISQSVGSSEYSRGAP